VGPNELQDEFRYKNEKIKLDYALIKPEDLAAKITPTDAEIKAEYEKNKSRYQIPEKRVVRYGLLDTTQMRRNIQVSDDQLKVQYQNNIQQYQVPNRVHAEHILFMTVGKTDAEVDEIKKNAEGVLQQAKKGAKFEDLAKKYSEDPGSKDKGGDLGWITQGQTVPEFEKTAFGLDKGQISDLVKTQYGFHIIKVLDVPVLLSPASGVSPVGGVALAEESTAALFFGLLVAVGVVFAFSPSVPALLVLDLLREEVLDAPEPLAVSVPVAAWFESVFFLVVAFFEVVEVSPELACVDFAESVESAAGFFFFFAAVESLCDWSVDCVD